MFAYFLNPNSINKVITRLPNKIFLLEMNLYIYLVFLCLYYFLIPTSELYFANQKENYEAGPLDYLYMTTIIHGTVGLGDMTISSNMGKVLKILHALCIILFNLTFFE